MERVYENTDLNSWLDVKRGFLDQEKTDILMRRTLRHLAKLDEQHYCVEPLFKTYGRDAKMHRSMAMFGSDYKFSKITIPNNPIPKFIKRLLNKVNKKLGTNYNAVLVNVYENGSKYIGAHSDDERELSKDNQVAGISIGATRKLRIKPKEKDNCPEKIPDLDMDNGMLFVMGGDFQTHFTHEIPKQLKVTSMRISYTFREHE